jgi:hypothetical protein
MIVFSIIYFINTPLTLKISFEKIDFKDEEFITEIEKLFLKLGHHTYWSRKLTMGLACGDRIDRQ